MLAVRQEEGVGGVVLAVRQEEGVGGVVLAVRQEEREGGSCACRWARGGKGEGSCICRQARGERSGELYLLGKGSWGSCLLWRS